MVRKLITVGIVLISFLFQDLVASDIFVKSSYAETKPKIIKKTSQPRMKSAPPNTDLQQKKPIDKVAEKNEYWISILANGGNILDLVFDPASEDTLYALIRTDNAEAVCRNRSVSDRYIYSSIKIYKSTDGGVIWELRGTIPLTIYIEPYTHCSGWYESNSKRRLYLDSRTSTVMYNAGFGSVQKSVDGGKSWVPLGGGIIPSANGTFDFSQDTNDPNILYVQLKDSWAASLTSNPLSIYTTFKSTNDGKTWGKLSDNGFIIDGVYYPPFSTLFENNPINVGRENWGNKQTFDCRDNFTIFAIKATPTSAFYGRCNKDNIYVKSNDNGKSWEKFLFPMEKTPEYTYTFDRILNQSNLIFGLEDRQEVLYSIFGYFNSGYYVCHRIYKSKDDGNTWEPIMQGLQSMPGVERKKDTGYVWSPCDGNPSVEPPPQLVISKSGVLYTTFGNGGIYKSADNGANWKLLPGLGLPTTSSFNIVIQKDKSAVYAYSGETLFRSLDGGFSWTRYKIVKQSRWETLNRLAFSEGNVKFTDWKAELTFWNLNVEKLYQDFRPTQIAVSSVNTNIIYIVSGSNLMKSEDGGQSWGKTSIYAGDANIFIEEGSPDTIWVSGKYGGISKGETKNGEIGWYGIDGSVRAKVDSIWAPLFKSIEETASMLEKKERGLALNYRAFREKLYQQVIYVKSFSVISKNMVAVANGLGGAYVSADGGKTWKMIFVGIDGSIAKAAKRYKQNPSNNWNEIGIFSTNYIAINPENLNVIYVATDRGVFRSLDGGENWSHLNNGLQGLNVKRIVADESFDSIFAETDSGVYRLSDKDMTWIKGKEIDLKLTENSQQ